MKKLSLLILLTFGCHALVAQVDLKQIAKF